MWKTRREFLACISRSLSLRAGDRRHWCGNPYPLRCASGGPLSFFGERKGGKNAVKTKVLKSFPRLRCRLHRSSLPRVSGCANFVPCFRIVSASPSAMRSALVLPWRDGERPLRLPCGAMWASRPTDILRAGAAGPMWASAPTERLTVDVRKGRPPGRPEPGLHRCSCKPVIASRWASWSQ